MTVEYHVPVSDMTTAYPPGAVSFIIPDIGGVKRNGAPYVPVTASNQVDSEWESHYDPSLEAYIFTNTAPFEADKPISGGFELLWSLNSRECTNGYTLTRQPVFRINNEGIKMPEMSFSYEAKRDYHKLDLKVDYLDYADSLNTDLNKPNTISYTYKTDFGYQKRARGADQHTYFVTVEVIDPDTGTIVSDSEMSKIIIQYFDQDNARHEAPLTKTEDPYHPGQQVWGFTGLLTGQSPWTSPVKPVLIMMTGLF